MIEQPTKILRIFVASPSDLKQEREAIKRAIQSFNQTSLENGFIVKAFYWEEMLPASGPAQQNINPEVDKCDVFWGMLWEQWGQPTKDYSSGFHEEFRRVEDRWIKTGSPEIMLYFKHPSKKSLKDPGEHIKQISNFRESIRQKHSYKEFKKLLDLVLDFNQLLFKKSTLAMKVQTIPEKASSPPLKTENKHLDKKLKDELSISGKVIATLKSDTKIVRNQIDDAAAAIQKAYKAGEFNDISGKAPSIDDSINARMYLLAHSLMSRRHTFEIIGVHEINLIYKDKTNLDLTELETHQIFRSIIGNSHNTVPGWHWLSKRDGKKISYDLLNLCIFDNDIHVRLNAVRALIQIGKNHIENSELRDHIFHILINSAEKSLILEGVRLVGVAGSLENIAKLEGSCIDHNEDSEVRDEAIIVRFRFRMKEDSQKAFDLLLEEPPSKLGKIKDEIIKLLTHIDKEYLFKALHHKAHVVRELVVKEMAKRKILTDEVTIDLLDDSSIVVRWVCLHHLVDNGKSYSVDEIRKILNSEQTTQPSLLSFLTGSKNYADDLITEIFRKLPTDELIPKASFLEDGALAYRALALFHFNEFQESLRDDLANDFKSVYIRTESFINATFKNLPDNLEHGFDFQELRDIFRDIFLVFALEALAKHGKAEDILLARKFMHNENPLVVKWALKILEKFGNKDDIPSLLSLIKNGSHFFKNEVSVILLKLATGDLGVYLQLLDSDNHEIIAMTLEAGGKFAMDDMMKRAKIIIRKNESGSIRLVALAFIVKNYSHEELELLLDDYIKNDSYYYNIVCWLDRIIYAPQPFKDVYRDMLLSWLKVKSSDN